MPFAIVIRDFFNRSYLLLLRFISPRELLSGRALRTTPNPAQDAAEFRNGELLLRTWLNNHFITVSEYSFGSDRIRFANLDSRPVPYAVTYSSISESR